MITESKILRPTLFKKFFLIFLIVTLIPLTIASYGSISKAENELKSSLNEKYYLITRQIINKFDETYVKSWIENLSLLAFSLDYKKGLDANSINSIIDVHLENLNELVILSVKLEGNENPLHFIKNEKNIAQEDSEIVQKFLLFDSSANFSEKNIVVGDLLQSEKTSKKFLPIELAFEFRENQKAVLRGVFEVSVILEKILRELSTGRSEVYITGKDGKVVLKNEFGIFEEKSRIEYSLTAKIIESLKGKIRVFQLESFDFKGENYVGFYSLTHFGNLGVLVVDKLEIAYILVQKMKSDIVFWITAAVFFSLIFSFFFSRSLSGSMRYLSMISHRIGVGDLDVEIKVTSKDEIGQLASSLSQMVVSLKQREQMIASIRYAQRIQNAILPLEEKNENILGEHFIIFKPKDNLSGDFYWFSEVEEKTFIAVVDCTGHGIPGAFMSMMGNVFLNHIVNEKEVFEPALVLENLHKSVRNALKQERKEIDATDGMDVCLCVIDKKNKKLTFAGAKRPLYIVRDGVFEEIKGDKKSIGGLQKEEKRTFTNNEIFYTLQATIYLTSDGFADQSNLNGEKFGSKRLKEFLAEISKYGLKKQNELLALELKKHQEVEEQRDDITIVGVKVS
ncbi:SpoIIE family protein phosphatase [bacterium]|nr:SpoIIE family protein phosphatase [bacterium]